MYRPRGMWRVYRPRGKFVLLTLFIWCIYYIRLTWNFTWPCITQRVSADWSTRQLCQVRVYQTGVWLVSINRQLTFETTYLCMNIPTVRPRVQACSQHADKEGGLLLKVRTILVVLIDQKTKLFCVKGRGRSERNTVTATVLYNE